MIRRLACVVLGLSLTGAALAACSSLSPNPPDPHDQADPLSSLTDGSTDGDALDGGGDAP